MRELDSGGAHYSQELSEVDLSDPEDVKVIAADASGEVLVHLGSGSYLPRYKTYITHVQQWRQQFDKLESVDLRYDGQIIVNPDVNGMSRQPALTPAAAKAAMAAGVKSAAIVNYEKYAVHHTAPAPSAVPAGLKKQEKGRANAGTKAQVKHTAQIPQPSSKKPAVTPAALKRPGNPVTTATPKNAKPAQPAAAAAPRVVVVTNGQKKPSAAIPKETSQN